MIRLRFSKKELGNIIVFTTVAAVFFIMCIPVFRRSGALKKELNSIRREIGSLDRGVLEKTDFSSDIEVLERDFVSLRNIIPFSEEEIIERFYKAASSHKVDIISISTQAQAKAGLKEEEKLSVSGKELTRKKVKVILEGGYVSLGKFLEGVRQEFRDTVVFDSLSMRKAGKEEVLSSEIEFFIWLG